jgi:hypothetical protein
MSIREKYQDRAESYVAARETWMRTPLTASQHILHLLLTVFTFGLWLPVWIMRAIQGNRTPVTPPQGIR